MAFSSLSAHTHLTPITDCSRFWESSVEADVQDVLVLEAYILVEEDESSLVNTKIIAKVKRPYDRNFRGGTRCERGADIIRLDD